MSQEDWGELERAAAAGRMPLRYDQDGLDLWLSLRGRISRSTYWLKFVLPIAVLQWLAAFVDIFALGHAPDQFGPTQAVVFLATFWPGIAAAVKRLHDLGHPGWYVAVFYGGTVGAGIALALAVPLFGIAGALAGVPFVFLMLGALWYSIKMMAFRGTIGPNQYGSDPVA